MGERKNPSALTWDKIKESDYSKTNSIPNLAAMIGDSKKRTNTSETFNLVRQTGARLKSQQDHNVYPLNEAKYMAKIAEGEAINKKLDQIDSAKTKLVVLNLKSDLEKVNVDTSSKEKNKKWIDALKKDAYLNETVNVLNEWIKVVAMKPTTSNK
ncbi:carboxy-terminal protease [compost metagenome]